VALVVTMYLATAEQELPGTEGVNDKVKHILAFFVLSFLADYSAPDVQFNLKKWLPVLGYGLLIEVVQYFLPYREFSLFDLAADGIGIAAYAYSLPILNRWKFFQRH